MGFPQSGAAILLTLAKVICALVLHELAHIFAVNYLGGRVQKVGVFPLGLGARFTGLERLCAWERYAIYAAGCAANALAAGWAFAVSRISYVGVPWLEAFAFYNMALCLFNLTPALPLDGGRMAHQFLSNRMGMRPAGRVLVWLGAYIGAALMVLGLVQVVLYGYNITLLCAGLYVRRKNRTLQPQLEADFFKMLAAKKRRTAWRRIKVKLVTVHPAMPLRQAMDRLTMDDVTMFWLAEENRPVTEAALVCHVLAHGQRGTLGDLPHGNRY